METQYKTQADLINAIYPITHLEMYANGGYKVRRTAVGERQSRIPERGEISGQSRKSLRRLMFFVQCTDVSFRSMMTLTYPKYYPLDGKIVKADLAALRQKLRRNGITYLWFLEFQERGAPHIHIMLSKGDISPRDRVDYGLYWTVRIATSDWFDTLCPPAEYPSEVFKMAKVNTHHTMWEKIRSVNGARGYVMKYASKKGQKKVPGMYHDAGRFWGCSRSVKPKVKNVVEVTDDEIRDWLERNGHPAYSWEVVPSSLWGVTVNGRV